MAGGGVAPEQGAAAAVVEDAAHTNAGAVHEQGPGAAAGEGAAPAEGAAEDVDEEEIGSDGDLELQDLNAEDVAAILSLPEPETPGSVLKWYQFRVGGVIFETLPRYQLKRPLGKGAYGLVCSAHDSETNQEVAIKRIGDIFHNLLDARRTLREMQILRHVRGHPNIITLLDLYPPSEGLVSFKDVYLVYEVMDSDLHQVIRSPQPLSEDHLKFFIYQLLRGLKYLHTCGVIHRDLKPSNLLVNANCELRICDLGLARASVLNGEVLVEYVVTRWYRAPELLLSCHCFGASVDIWSVGCILAELLGRKPLFPGKDFVHQINLICKVIGTPTEEEIGQSRSEKARAYLRSMPYMPKGDFKQYFPKASPLALDFLDKLLTFDPRKRPNVHEALKHPWLAPLHDPSDEPPCALPFEPEEEMTLNLSIEHIRRGIAREMLFYNPGLELANLPMDEDD